MDSNRGRFPRSQQTDTTVRLSLIHIFLGGYGVYTLWDDRQIYQRADMENYETWRPEEDDDLSFRELQAINPEVIGWLTAVSYTHLDVYKRQVQMLLRIP